MKKNIRLEESLAESVFDRLFETSKSQRWLVRRNEKLNELIESCANESEQLLICDILDRFTYVDGDVLADSLQELGRKITDCWGCTPSDTLIVALDKSRFADSSSAIAWMIKPVLAELGDWETNTVYRNLSEALVDVKSGQKMVVIDEFVGSGQTLSGKLKWISAKLAEDNKVVDIYVATVAAMEIAKTRDFSSAKDFHSTIWLKQGLNDYYSGEDLINATKMMLSLEDNLNPRHNFTDLKKYSLGYKKSQSTYYLENGNPPNNNFPIFWWKVLKNGDRRKPLLPRI